MKLYRKNPPGYGADGIRILARFHEGGGLAATDVLHRSLFVSARSTREDSKWYGPRIGRWPDRVFQAFLRWQWGNKAWHIGAGVSEFVVGED